MTCPPHKCLVVYVNLSYSEEGLCDYALQHALSQTVSGLDSGTLDFRRLSIKTLNRNVSHQAVSNIVQTPEAYAAPCTPAWDRPLLPASSAPACRLSVILSSAAPGSRSKLCRSSCPSVRELQGLAVAVA